MIFKEITMQYPEAPAIILSPYDRSLGFRPGLELEKDCACSLPNAASLHPAPARVKVGTGDHYQTPPLIQQHLPAEWTLLCNPTAHHSLAVVTASVLDLLAAFDRPRTLDDGIRHAGTPAHGPTTARRLVELGLLHVPGTKPAPSPRDTTLTAWLHVTNACNLRCTYCYVDKSAAHMPADTGHQAIDAILRSAQANHFERVKLKYAGGEATLNFARVLELHAYARQQAARHDLALDGVVLSNGVAWNHRMIDALQTHDLRLMISLDGIGPAHDRQRPFAGGQGTFTHVVRSLDRLAQAGVTPTISVTLTDHNLATLSETVAFILQRQLPFSVNFYRPNDCVTNPAALALRDEQVIAALRATFAVIEANLPPFSLLDCLADLAQLDALHDRPCGAGHNYLVIDHAGQVSRCHMELDQPITDINANDPLLTLRAHPTGWRNGPVSEKTGCQTCSWRYWCAGGCPLLTHRTTGRWDVQSPYCGIYQAIFPEILRLEGLRLLRYALPRTGQA